MGSTIRRTSRSLIPYARGRPIVREYTQAEVVVTIIQALFATQQVRIGQLRNLHFINCMRGICFETVLQKYPGRNGVARVGLSGFVVRRRVREYVHSKLQMEGFRSCRGAAPLHLHSFNICYIMSRAARRLEAVKECAEGSLSIVEKDNNMLRPRIHAVTLAASGIGGPLPTPPAPWALCYCWPLVGSLLPVAKLLTVTRYSPTRVVLAVSSKFGKWPVRGLQRDIR
jgi:hypothetical protein